MAKRFWKRWKNWWWPPALALFLLAGVWMVMRSLPLAPEQVARRAGDLHGQRVTVRGRVEMIGLSCTEAFCPENPCCNACWSGLGFEVEGGAIYLIGAEIGCTGNSCEVACAPFEVGETYTVTGILSDTLPPFLEIDVESFEVDR